MVGRLERWSGRAPLAPPSPNPLKQIRFGAGSGAGARAAKRRIVSLRRRDHCFDGAASPP
jgi:hypothetical protein